MTISTSDIPASVSGSGKGSGGFFGSGIGNVLGSAISGLFGYLSANKINRDNIQYQQDYNEQVFKRADTQYQRTVADLRAAGLSSQLAAGASSSVAGNTSAPQGDVSAESEAIARIVDLVNSVKRTDADVNLANAQIDKSNAEADKASAEADYTRVQAGIAPQDLEIRKATAKANTDYTIAMTRLQQLEGDNFVKKLNVEFEKAYSAINVDNKLADLYEMQKDLAEAQTGKVNAERSEVKERIEKIKQEVENLKIDFDNKVKEGLHTDASTSLLVQQASNAWLDYQVTEYNLMLSEGLALRTTENIPSNIFSQIAWTGHTFDEMFWGRRDTNLKRFVKDVREWNWEWTPLRWIIEKDYPWNK